MNPLFGIILKRHMAVKKKHRDKITEAFADPEKITEALSRGVREALFKNIKRPAILLLSGAKGK